jgi:hypothetical protein
MKMEAMENNLFRIEEDVEQNVSEVVKYYIVKNVKTNEILYKFSIFIGGDVFVSKANNVFIKSSRIRKVEHQRKTKLVPKYTKISFNEEDD